MTSSTAVRDLLDLLLPRGCLACGERIPPEEGVSLVCPPCQARLKAPPPPFCPRCQAPRGTGHAPGEICLECQDWPRILVSARAAVVLDSVSGAMIHALKYRGGGNMAEVMGEKMAKNGAPGLASPLVVPVPTTRWRRRTRGYNQAAALAEALSRSWDLPMAEVLSRRAGRTQVRLTPRERAANVRRAFDISPAGRSRIRGRDVILVDDVLTTGATARAVVKALEEGGAASVQLRTFARSLPFSS